MPLLLTAGDLSAQAEKISIGAYVYGHDLEGGWCMKKLLNTLYVTIPDAYLALDGENVVIYAAEDEKREEKGRYPLHNLDNIVTRSCAMRRNAVSDLRFSRSTADSNAAWRENGGEMSSCGGSSTGSPTMRSAPCRLPGT